MGSNLPCMLPLFIKSLQQILEPAAPLVLWLTHPTFSQTQQMQTGQ